MPKDYAGKLARFFINSPLTVIFGITLLAIGYLSLMIMPREENPQMVVSGSTVIVALPGATAQEVENVIVKPLERKMKEVLGIEHIQSMAMDNVGVVNAAFFIGEEKEDSNLKIYDKIMQNMDIFPKNAMQPVIKPLDIDVDIPIVSVAFYANDPAKLDDTQLYDAVKNLQHHINGLPNVAVTALKGGHKHQYNIKVDLNKLAGYNLSLGQISQAVQALAYNVPAVKNRTKDGEIVIMGIKNALESVRDVEDIIVAQYMGAPIHLRDVADVEDGYDIQNFKSATISVRKNGTFSPAQEQVTLTISKLKGTNAVVIAEEVKKELEKYKSQLEKAGIKYSITRNDGERANVSTSSFSTSSSPLSSSRSCSSSSWDGANRSSSPSPSRRSWPSPSLSPTLPARRSTVSPSLHSCSRWGCSSMRPSSSSRTSTATSIRSNPPTCQKTTCLSRRRTRSDRRPISRRWRLSLRWCPWPSSAA